jgi:hypothetical protein
MISASLSPSARADYRFFFAFSTDRTPEGRLSG